MPITDLRILDTTLRDGADAPGFAPTDPEREAITRALVAARVDVIELASSDAPDPGAVRALCTAAGTAECCVIGPASSDTVQNALSLLCDAQRPRIHLYADVSGPDALARALEAIFAARTNVEQVEFSPLRAFDRPVEAVAEVALAATDSGATIVNLSDSAGTADPEAVRALFTGVVERLGRHGATSFHGHDDGGRAVANAVAACESGARQVHVCVSGVGPRGGNTNFVEFVAALDGRPNASADPLHVDRGALPELTRLVDRARA